MSAIFHKNKTFFRHFKTLGLWMVSLAIFLLHPLIAYGNENGFLYKRHTLEFKQFKWNIRVYNPGIKNAPLIFIIPDTSGVVGPRVGARQPFLKDLTDLNMIVIEIEYMDTIDDLWLKAIAQSIKFGQNIENANQNKVGLLGFSLGGTLALQTAADISSVQALVLHSAYLPKNFKKAQAQQLPKTLFITGSKNRQSYRTLQILNSWLDDKNKIKQIINLGEDDEIHKETFEENWQSTVSFLKHIIIYNNP